VATTSVWPLPAHFKNHSIPPFPACRSKREERRAEKGSIRVGSSPRRSSQVRERRDPSIFPRALAKRRDTPLFKSKRTEITIRPASGPESLVAHVTTHAHICVGLGPSYYPASLLWSPGPRPSPVFRSAICDCLSLNVSISHIHFQSSSIILFFIKRIYLSLNIAPPSPALPPRPPCPPTSAARRAHHTAPPRATRRR
jgi:hypothetical protein